MADERTQVVVVPLELWKDLRKVLSAHQFIYDEDGWLQDDNDDVQEILKRMDKEVK